jgi:DNA-binding NarL/FixJ family response regulator
MNIRSDSQANPHTSIRVLLADDHAVVRKGIREFLEDDPQIVVIGEVSDGLLAVEQALALRPDLVVMDVAMPGLNGIEATRRIRAAAPEIRVLALSAYNDDPYIFGLLDAGAAGYMLKTADARAIVQAVRDVAAGRTVLDPSIAARVVAHATRSKEAQAPLSEREREVLQLASRGLTNKQIGVHLHISDRTVQNHLANIYVKLSVASRTEAVTAALQQGMIRLGE